MGERKYSTIQQHEPLRTPSSWTDQERRFVSQLEEIFDDIYRRFNRIRLSDLNSDLRETVKSSFDGVNKHETKISQTAEKLESLASDQSGLKTQATQTAEKLESLAADQSGLKTQVTQTAEKLESMASTSRNIYTGYAEPEVEPKTGDMWHRIASPALSWAELCSGTWAQAAGKLWGDVFSPAPQMYTWDGSQWILVTDKGDVEVLQTYAVQTAEKLESVAEELGQTKSAFTQTAGSISARVEEVASATPSELKNASVHINVDGIAMSGGEIDIDAGAKMKIASGGTFEVESENFNVSPEGNVSMKDAVVSGNLSQDGFSVLTQKNLIISSTAPEGLSNRVWVKPVSNVVLTYTHGVESDASFQEYNAAHLLNLQGSTASGSGVYQYTLYIPYRTRTSLEKTRTLTATLTGNGQTLTMQTTLSNTGGYTGTAQLSATASFWLGELNEISFTLKLEADNTSHVYDYHRVTPGAIQLICAAKGSESTGWSSAEIYVYQ